MKQIVKPIDGVLHLIAYDQQGRELWSLQQSNQIVNGAYEIAAEALERLEVDYLGLDRIDRRILSTIIQNYAGGPVGLDTLAAAVGEESVTLEDVYEPYLMQIGFLTRTPRGRCVTRLAYNHLHLEAPDGAADAQMTLQC